MDKPVRKSRFAISAKPLQSQKDQKPRPTNSRQPRSSRQPSRQIKPSEPAKLPNLTPVPEATLRIIPMGGVGKEGIGKNMMAIEYQSDILIVDMGMAFPTEETPGIDYIIADPTYLEVNKHKIRGLLITHAHLDHIGGIPYILPKFPVPIYGSKFTVKFIEKNISEFKFTFKPQFRMIDPDLHEKVRIGVFDVEFVRVIHSIVDACAVVIGTPAGKIINTGDYRFDDNPYDGVHADKARFKELGDQGVLLLMADSTSCYKPGYSVSERIVSKGLEEVFEKAGDSRMIVSAFASSITRLQMILDLAYKYKRTVLVDGRSMLSNIELAIKYKYINVKPGAITPLKGSKKFPDSKTLILCTGSQGEYYASLARIARKQHASIELKKGDSVVMSNSIIPGNDQAISKLVDQLMRLGAYVYQDSFRDFDQIENIHSSGHAGAEETKEMISLVRPSYFIPIHGDYSFLVRNGINAQRAGINPDNIFVVEDGQSIEFSLVDGIAKGRLGPKFPSGPILLGGSRTGAQEISPVVVRDRKSMGEDGVFVLVANIDKHTGVLLHSPDIISRGFVYMKDNEELIFKARSLAKRLITAAGKSAQTQQFKNKLRERVGEVLTNQTDKTPMVLVIINSI